MNASDVYDCIVIGKGLVGSAAAKYLKQSLNKVAIVGPDEPVENIGQATVFASHYDQSRVQRVIGVDPIWTRLNKQSVVRYPKLEKESGIQFHYPVGCLYVSPNGKDEYLRALPEQANQFRLPYNFLESGDLIRKSFPEFTFPDASFGMLEQEPSGYINPRQLIKAQLKMFAKSGGVINTNTVVNIVQTSSGVQIITNEGYSYNSKKVLIAAGAFSNFSGLMQRPVYLELESETVLLAEVEEAEAQRLSKLPALLYEIETELLNGIYLVRPTLYPNGKYYLKIGCNLAQDLNFNSLDKIQNWFRNGDSDSNIPVMKKVLHSIMPNLKVISYSTKRCIVTRTKHRHYYIGNTDRPNVYIATGGNGFSAMCSDELGRVTSHFAQHELMPEGYSKKSFIPIYA